MVSTSALHILAERLHADDHAAFTEFVTHHYERALRVAFAIVQSHDIAKDITQDIFIRLWERRHTITAEQLTTAYVFSAIHRRSLDILKHDRVRQRYTESQATVVTTVPPVDEQILTRAEFDGAMQQLPERWQIVLRLRLQEDVSIPEIAAVFGLSPNAVHQLLHRAVRQLRDLLERN